MSKQTEAIGTAGAADDTTDAAVDTTGIEGTTDATETSGGARHSAREVALQVLYAIDLGARSARLAGAADPSSDSTATSSRTGERGEGESQPSERASLGAGNGVEAEAGVPAASPLDIERMRADGERAFERVTEHFVVQRSAVAFARELVAAVVARSPELDELLGIHARNWRVSRMAAVDRNVLRLAVYELRDTQTPVAVVIDEAVDLARRFGSDSSPAFVNGVLDAVAREVRLA